MLENNFQPVIVSTDEESEYNRLNNMVSDLDSFIKKAIENINNRNYTGTVNATHNGTVRNTGSKATKKANQKRKKERRERKYAGKSSHTPTKPKGSNKSYRQSS